MVKVKLRTMEGDHLRSQAIGITHVNCDETDSEDSERDSDDDSDEDGFSGA
jgi:hypothetical protein